jgi:hypothetical protein
MITELGRIVSTLLSLGLTITTARTSDGYMCKVTGLQTCTGVGETFAEALERASWRWVLN